MGETKKVILKVRNLSKDFRLRSASFGGEKKNTSCAEQRIHRYL